MWIAFAKDRSNNKKSTGGNYLIYTQQKKLRVENNLIYNFYINKVFKLYINYGVSLIMLEHVSHKNNDKCSLWQKMETCNCGCPQIEGCFSFSGIL